MVIIKLFVFFVHTFDQGIYSKAPIIRTEHWAVLAVHSMYCRTGISTGTYNRNFRVCILTLALKDVIYCQSLYWSYASS